MKGLRSAIIGAILALQVYPALAWFPHGAAALLVNTSQSAVNILDASMFPFVNFMKEAFFNPSEGTFAYPGALTANNLPSGTLSTTLQFYGVPLPANYQGKFVLAASVTTSGGNGISFSGAGQVYSVGAGTTVNCGAPPCAFTNGLNITGTNPVVTLDFSTTITGAVNNGSGLVRLSITNAFGSIFTNGESVTVTGVVGSDGNGCGANGNWTLSGVTSTTVDLVGSTFPGGCTYTSGGQFFPFQSPTTTGGGTYAPNFSFQSGTTFTNFTSLIMCKQADYLADSTCQTTSGKTAWTGGFNDDFITALGNLRPHHIRYLDVNNNVFLPSPDFNNWTPTTNFSYGLVSSNWSPSRWFGSDSGTNTYSITCSSPCTYALTGGAPADGDVFEFQNVNVSTSANPTLTITDINSTTSSAIPIFDQSGEHLVAQIGGTITNGDSISLTFNTTPSGAFTCLSGGTHTTSAYSITGSDTTTTIANGLAAIVNGDTTLTALPTDVVASGIGSGKFSLGFANQACATSVTANITGSATETFTVGTLTVGALNANKLYTGVYSSRLQGIVLNTTNPGSGGSATWPWLTQIQLAKALSTKTGYQVGCWLQVPLLWSNASFQSLANFENANQCPGGVNFELGNEIWNTGNSLTSEADHLANALGLGQTHATYEMLRSRELFGLGKTIYGSIGGHFLPVMMQQRGNWTNALIQGANLCGNSCSNPAYQAGVGTDYNSSPNQPAQFSYAIGQAPYYEGGVLQDQTVYGGTYGTFSITGSIASNVLTVTAVGSGTVFWNQGIASSICAGVFIDGGPSAQLTGTVTTTLNGATTDNQTTWTLTSTSGLSTGMWIYNSTTGMTNGTIASINSGANQISVTAGKKTYRSSGSNDTIIFGGQAGTYQLNNTTCAKTSQTITGGDIAGLQAAADNYNSLNGALGSQADAMQWVYQDALNAVKNSSLAPTFTVQSNVNSYNTIDAVAVTNSQVVWDYEGSYQGQAPTTSQATSIGLSSSAYGGTGGFVDILINGSPRGNGA